MFVPSVFTTTTFCFAILSPEVLPIYICEYVIEESLEQLRADSELQRAEVERLRADLGSKDSAIEEHKHREQAT